MRSLLGDNFVNSVRVSDRYPPLDLVASAGWVLEDGATLLAEFRTSYFGHRSAFVNTGSFEVAVNGRGIPDLDIQATGVGRIDRLMRRGISFAWDALYEANSLPWKPTLMARVSAGPILTDPETYTGYVTFFSAEFAKEVGVMTEVDLSGLQVIMSTEDCVTPLSGSAGT